MADKPSPEPQAIERWTAQRKAAIILEVLKGQISVPEVARTASRRTSTARGPKNTIAPASTR
jgi:transposase-like protein